MTKRGEEKKNLKQYINKAWQEVKTKHKSSVICIENHDVSSMTLQQSVNNYKLDGHNRICGYLKNNLK